MPACCTRTAGKAGGPACTYKFKELRRRPLPEKPTARDDKGDRSTMTSSGPLSASFPRAAALGRRAGIPSSGSAYRLVLIVQSLSFSSYRLLDSVQNKPVGSRYEELYHRGRKLFCRQDLLQQNVEL